MEKTGLVEQLITNDVIVPKVSSKQLEAKITAVTLILGAIIVNILWWTGLQFMKTDNNKDVTQKAQEPIEQKITKNGL